MAVSTRQVKNKRNANGVLTGRAGTVYDVNIKYTTPEGAKSTYAKKGFLTRKDALQHEAEMRVRLQTPCLTSSAVFWQKQTLRDYLNEWVEGYVRLNLRPATYENYKCTVKNYIIPYIGGVSLGQLSPAAIDCAFQEMLAKGLKPGTVEGAKRVLCVALNHARKYQYIETNPASNTLTRFGKSDKTPSPYTIDQMAELLQKVAGTEWEMPVMLGGLYGLRRSEILGLRWKNVDLEKGIFDVVEQLPFDMPSKTTVIKEMAPPKSYARQLPLTDTARLFFKQQAERQATFREQAGRKGKPYYENDLVVAKSNGAPQTANWISAGFHKLLSRLGMPHIRFHDLRHTAATNMHEITGDFYTVGEILGHTLGGISASLGMSMNYEAVTARYVDVRLEKKKEVLDAYHEAVRVRIKDMGGKQN